MFNSAWICVEKCPTKLYTRTDQLKEKLLNATDKSLNCVYDFKFGNFSEYDFTNLGPCPRVPIYER